MFTYPVWMPCARKHELTELAKVARGAAKGRTYEPVPYRHVKGKLIATLQSDKLAALYVEAAEGARIMAQRPPPAPVIPMHQPVPPEQIEAMAA
jgi:hypothetical protein